MKHRWTWVLVASLLLLESCGQSTARSSVEESGSDGVSDQGGLVPAPRGALPAPILSLSDADRAKFVPLPIKRGAVPVLRFQSICEVRCSDVNTFGISRAEFARMMLMLEAAGYSTVSLAGYQRIMADDFSDAPDRPILLTFDDGRLDAFRNADRILAALSMRAAMFVITGRAEPIIANYLSWFELSSLEASGRWDLQLHAHKEHRLVQAGITAAGEPAMRSAYGWLRYDPQAFPTEPHLEPFESWRDRIEGDVSTGIALLSAHIPGYQPIAFAVPYNDYGQLGSNDERVVPELEQFFRSRFGFWFTQPPTEPAFNSSGGGPSQQRFSVESDTSADVLYAWLSAQASK